MACYRVSFTFTFTFITFFVRSALRSLCIYWARGWTVRGSNPGRCKRFLYSAKPSFRFWGPIQPPVQWVPGLCPGRTAAGRDVEYSLPSSAEVKNEWSPTCVVWTGTSLLSVLTSLNGARAGIESLEYLWFMPFLFPIQSLFFLTFLQSGMLPLTFPDPKLAVFFVSHCMLRVLPSSHRPSAVKRTVHIVSAMSKGLGLKHWGSGCEFHMFAGRYIRYGQRSVQADLPTNWLDIMCESPV